MGRFTVAGLCLLAVLLSLVAYRLLPLLSFLRIFTLLPVLACIYPAVVERGRAFHDRIIPAALILAVVAAQLPTVAGAAVAVISVVLFTLITEQQQQQQQQQTKQNRTTNSGPDFVTALISIILMIGVLLVENFLIWVVSATFPAGQHVATAPPPLQDNGQLLLQHVFQGISKHDVIGLRRLWNTQWALVACLAAAFLVAERFHPRRTLFSVASRAMFTVAVARSIRTVSFLLTVLPSQVPGCYSQRFPAPPPPEDLWEWIYVGLQPRSHGGCNDLIISGHATITATMACVATSLAGQRTFTVALWSMVVLDYAVEIYEGFHYSVDMWLGMVLVILVWRVMGCVEANLERKEQAATVQVSWQRAVLYSPPAIVTYLQMTLLPEATANFVILAFVVICVAIFLRCIWRQDDAAKKQFYVHYVQHTFLCLLVLAFGIYL